jgi:hypothetical protein
MVNAQLTPLVEPVSVEPAVDADEAVSLENGVPIVTKGRAG